MSDEKQPSILELQARWDKIRIANLYDTLDKMGYYNQCLDLSIRPLFPKQHLAGVAVTARGSRDPTSWEEKKAAREKAEAEGKPVMTGPNLHECLFPGCVVVVDGGGEPHTGKFGEMTSWDLMQRGAKGIVIDGFIRDLLGLEVIPNYTVCAKVTSSSSGGISLIAISQGLSVSMTIPSWTLVEHAGTRPPGPSHRTTRHIRQAP